MTVMDTSLSDAERPMTPNYISVTLTGGLEHWYGYVYLIRETMIRDLCLRDGLIGDRVRGRDFKELDVSIEAAKGFPLGRMPVLAFGATDADHLYQILAFAQYTLPSTSATLAIRSALGFKPDGTARLSEASTLTERRAAFSAKYGIVPRTAIRHEIEGTVILANQIEALANLQPSKDLARSLDIDLPFTVNEVLWGGQPLPLRESIPIPSKEAGYDGIRTSQHAHEFLLIDFYNTELLEMIDENLSADGQSFTNPLTQQLKDLDERRKLRNRLRRR